MKLVKAGSFVIVQLAAIRVSSVFLFNCLGFIRKAEKDVL